MAFQGKSIFNWHTFDVANGDPFWFAKLLVDARFDAVWLKAANGPIVFADDKRGPNVTRSLVQALHNVGVRVYLWHFLYGYDPVGELKVAQKQCTDFQPEGYIFDVESAFDGQKSAEANARLISVGLKKSHPHIPQALCWWALPKDPERMTNEWHPVKVANAFLETVDVVVPMMYWGGSTPEDSVAYLLRSLLVWQTITKKPMVPVGRAYNGDGGTISGAAITAFNNKVVELSKSRNLVGISWWLLDQAVANPAAWTALSKSSFGVPPSSDPGSTKPFVSDTEKIDRLVKAHPELFPELQ